MVPRPPAGISTGRVAASSFVPCFLSTAAVQPQEVPTFVILRGDLPWFLIRNSWVISGPSSTSWKSKLGLALKTFGAFAKFTVGVAVGGIRVDAATTAPAGAAESGGRGEGNTRDAEQKN